MTSLNLLYIVVLMAVAAFCVLVVLYPGYNDNFMQRMGAMVVCISAVSEIFHVVQQPNARTAIPTLMCGVVIAGLGTLVKARRKGKHHA